MKIIDAGLKFKSNYSVRSGSVNGFVLHHAAANGSVETIHKWHLDKGWAGIGYHFYVRKDGSVYRGRPENWVGAHTSGHNATKIGICAEGNFEKETMSDAQKNAIIELLSYLRGKYGNQKVYGHRDLDATACPGKNYPFNEIVNGKKNSTSEEVKKEGDSTVNIELLVLGKGDEGEQVKTLQRILVGLGYDLGKFGSMKNGVDGDFGDKTVSAVKTYQKLHNLDVDGIVGKDTWSKLLKG